MNGGAKKKIAARFSQIVQEMPIEDVCSHYKFIGITDPRLAFDSYIADTGMKPAFDSQDFQSVFSAARARDLRVLVDFEPNMYDRLAKCAVQVTQDNGGGVWRMLWANGLTGTNPPHLPPDPERFVTMTEEA